MATRFDTLTAIAKEQNPFITSLVGTPGYPANGETDWTPVSAVGATADALLTVTQGEFIGGKNAVSALANPTTAPTLTTSTTGGSLLAGVYQVGYTYKNTFGETQISSLASITIPSGTSTNKINIAAITPLPSGVSGVNWYLSAVAGGPTVKYIASNNGAALSLNSLPLSGAVSAPSSNTTNAPAHATIKSFVAGTGIGLNETDTTLTISATGVSVPVATDTAQGTVKISHVASDPTDPVALGMNDPLVNSIGKIGTIPVTGTAAAGKYPRASSSSTAAWAFPVPYVSSLPGSGNVVGDEYTLSTDGHRYYYNGTTFIDQTGSSGTVSTGVRAWRDSGSDGDFTVGASSSTHLQFGQETDPDNFFDPTTANETFIVPTGKAGWYNISLNIVWAADDTDPTSTREVTIIHNSSSTVGKSTVLGNLKTGLGSTQTFPFDLYLDEGDSINVQVTNNSSNDVNILADGTYFSMKL